jgi:acetyl esterase/lipase
MTLSERFLHGRRRFMAWAGAGAALLQGCSATGALNAVAAGNHRQREGVAYGNHPRQKLDVYLPEQVSSATPVVVFFYGGAWTHGDRADYRFVGESLAGAGLAVVVPD